MCPLAGYAVLLNLCHLCLPGCCGATVLCGVSSWVLKVTPSADMDVSALADSLPPALHKGTAPNPEVTLSSSFLFFGCSQGAKEGSRPLKRKCKSRLTTG